MNRLSLILIILLHFASLLRPLDAQTVIQWQCFPRYNYYITCFLDLDSTVLIGSSSGNLCYQDPTTLQMKYLNSCNSGLKGSLRCIEKDDSGNVWIGSNCGLIQWQGNTWNHFTSQNSVMTVDDVTSLMYCSPMNALLLGLSDGNVIQLDTSGWTYLIGINGSKPQARVTDIEYDTNGNIWAAAGIYGVYRFNGTDWQAFNNSSIPNLNYVYSIAIDTSSNVLWVLGSLYLFSYDGTNWINHGSSPAWENHYISVEDNNTIWISSSSGIVLYNGTSFSYHSSNNYLTSGHLWTHLVDKIQNFWVGTFNDGVDYVSGVNITHFPLTPDLTTPRVFDIAFDKTASKVWFATYDNTANQSFAGIFNDTSWVNLSPLNSPLAPGTITTSIAIDSNSLIYFGTENKGLWMKQGNNWSNYTKLNSNLFDDTITSIAIDKNNHLLVGYKQGVVQLFVNNSFVTLIQDSNLKCRLNRIEIEDASTFWVATDSGGVIRSDYVSYSVFNITNSGIPSNHVKDIKFDALHQIWIATDSGLACYNGSTWAIFNTVNSGLPENQTTSLTIASDSSVWISTVHNGVAILKGNTWAYFNKCNFQTFSNIKVIKTGPDGRIYIGGDGVVIAKIDLITNFYQVFSEPTNIQVYPNPGSGIIHFDIKGPLKPNVTLYVYNSLGEKVFSKQIKSTNQDQVNILWDTSAGRIPPGIYFYCIDNLSFRESGKVVVVK